MNVLSKYAWLVDKLLIAGDRGLTKAEIDEKWVNWSHSDGLPIPRQTFTRWRNAIPDAFGVDIECDRRNENRYFISDPTLLDSGKMSKWLLDTYTTYETLSKHISLNNRIILENIPSSRNHLAEILEAMHENKVIEITYERFTEPGQFTLKVHPYCVRIMDRRWYMLAMYPKAKDLRIYGLDRIQSLTITGQTFKMKKSFDAETYFAKDFGLVHKEDVKQERIVLRATKPHYNYLRSLPLHRTQKEIHACEEYVDFELFLRPTYDFCYELLRHADMVEVIEPESLRTRMRDYSSRLAEMYK